MKIAFSGPMGSGKTYLKDFLKNEFPQKFYTLSFSEYIYKIAIDLFQMQEKDRGLLIKIGKALTNIDKDVFINYTMNQVKEHEHIIIDDARLPNEFIALKENGFLIIQLNISETLQIQRLRQKYGETYQKHLEYKKDITEQMKGLIQPDLVLHVDNNEMKQQLLDFINCN